MKSNFEILKATRVNSKVDIPYIPKHNKEQTNLQRRLLEAIPAFPNFETTYNLAKKLGITAARVESLLTIEFCIDFLICEDDKKISKCQRFFKE